MVEAAAGGANGTGVVARFAGTLLARLENGSYAAEKAGWVQCRDVAVARRCALLWAQDANLINCLYVLGVNETGRELGGAYYEGARPWIELQIAKGGYRLGAWLNAVAGAVAGGGGEL